MPASSASPRVIADRTSLAQTYAACPYSDTVASATTSSVSLQDTPGGDASEHLLVGDGGVATASGAPAARILIDVRTPLPRFRLRGDAASGPLVLVDRVSDEDPGPGPPFPPATDVGASRAATPPLSCRLRLWHAWRLHHVAGGSTYVSCDGCGRYMQETLFERPWE